MRKAIDVLRRARKFFNQENEQYNYPSTTYTAIKLAVWKVTPLIDLRAYAMRMIDEAIANGIDSSDPIKLIDAVDAAYSIVTARREIDKEMRYAEAYGASSETLRKIISKEANPPAYGTGIAEKVLGHGPYATGRRQEKLGSHSGAVVFWTTCRSRAVSVNLDPHEIRLESTITFPWGAQCCNYTWLVVSSPLMGYPSSGTFQARCPSCGVVFQFSMTRPLTEKDMKSCTGFVRERREAQRTNPSPERNPKYHMTNEGVKSANERDRVTPERNPRYHGWAQGDLEAEHAQLHTAWMKVQEEANQAYRALQEVSREFDARKITPPDQIED